MIEEPGSFIAGEEIKLLFFSFIFLRDRQFFRSVGSLTFFVATVNIHFYNHFVIMPPKSNKKCQGPSLYKTFVDAYIKAHPNETYAVKLFFNTKKKNIFFFSSPI